MEGAPQQPRHTASRALCLTMESCRCSRMTARSALDWSIPAEQHRAEVDAIVSEMTAVCRMKLREHYQRLKESTALQTALNMEGHPLFQHLTFSRGPLPPSQPATSGENVIADAPPLQLHPNELQTVVQPSRTDYCRIPPIRRSSVRVAPPPATARRTSTSEAQHTSGQIVSSVAQRAPGPLKLSPQVIAQLAKDHKKRMTRLTGTLKNLQQQNSHSAKLVASNNSLLVSQPLSRELDLLSKRMDTLRAQNSQLFAFITSEKRLGSAAVSAETKERLRRIRTEMDQRVAEWQALEPQETLLKKALLDSREEVPHPASPTSSNGSLTPYASNSAGSPYATPSCSPLDVGKPAAATATIVPNTKLPNSNVKNAQAPISNQRRANSKSSKPTTAPVVSQPASVAVKTPQELPVLVTPQQTVNREANSDRRTNAKKRNTRKSRDCQPYTSGEAASDLDKLAALMANVQKCVEEVQKALSANEKNAERDQLHFGGMSAADGIATVLASLEARASAKYNDEAEMTEEEKSRMQRLLEAASSAISQSRQAAQKQQAVVAQRQRGLADARSAMRHNTVALEQELDDLVTKTNQALRTRQDLFAQYIRWRRRKELGDQSVANTFAQELDRGPRTAEATTQINMHKDFLPKQVLHLMSMMKRSDRIRAHVDRISTAAEGMRTLDSVMGMHLTCELCHRLLTDPASMWPCGHSLCQECFYETNVGAGAHRCPVCGVIGTEGSVPNVVMGELLASGTSSPAECMMS